MLDVIIKLKRIKINTKLLEQTFAFVLGCRSLANVRANLVVILYCKLLVTVVVMDGDWFRNTRTH